MLQQSKYAEYLKSAEWKHTKSIKLKLAKHTCEGCNEFGRALEVHHLTYDRIGMELLTDLVVYCSECHSKAHGKEEPTKWNLYLSGKTDEKPKERLVQDIELEKIINSI